MLIDKLRMPVATQQHAKIIEPGDDALQLHAIHQKNGEWNFVFADVIEKCVLKILCAVGCHGRCPVLCAASPCPTVFSWPFTSFLPLLSFPQNRAKPLAGTTIRRRGGQRCKPKFKAALAYPASAYRW